MALLVGLLGLEPALNFLCLDLEVGWLASGRRAEALVGRRVVRCCRGCVAGAALWGAHVLRSGYGRDSGAENNNNNNTAITTDWTLPSFAKARFASPVVYPPVFRVRRASADCLLYYVFITFMQGVYSIHRDIPATRENKGICIIQRSNIPILLPAITPCHPQTSILSLHKRHSRVSIEPCLTSYQQQPTFPASSVTITQYENTEWGMNYALC